MKKIYAVTLPLTFFYALKVNAQNISVNTTGAANSTSSILEVLQPSGTSGTSGLFVRHSGSPATAYGLWVEMTGAPTNKYAIIVPNGKGLIGFGTSAPQTQLTVAGDGAGVANIGGGFCGGNYTGISLNGLVAGCGSYNILSSTTDQNFYINRPTGYGMYFRENNGEQMLIATGGNVGIGTTTTPSKLTLTNSAYVATAMSDVGDFSIKDAAPQINFDDVDNNDWAIHVNSNKMYFIRQPWNYTDLVLDGAGNIGIGTDVPSYKLHVDGSNATRLAYVTNSNSAGYALEGTNTAGAAGASGAGVVGVNTNQGLAGTYSAYGIWGRNTYASGSGNGGSGVAGYTNQENGTGTLGWSFHASGTGAIGAGQNVALATSPVGGAGGAFTGSTFGLYTNASLVTAADRIPLLCHRFTSAGANVDTYVGSYILGTNYKIYSNIASVVSSVVTDLQGKKRIIACPEAPEVLIMDYGTGTLVNGKAHITLDPIISNNIYVDEKKPLKVLVTLNGDCEGVYVANRTKYGFDVIELKNGNSSAEFTWQIAAVRSDELNPDGSIESNTQNWRLPLAPPDIEIKSSKPAEEKK